MISNLPAFHAAIAAVAPIDGVAADGHIFFQATATPAQITAANATASAYTDPPPVQIPDLAALVRELELLGVLPAASVAKVMKLPALLSVAPPIAPPLPARSSPF